MRVRVDETWYQGQAFKVNRSGGVRWNGPRADVDDHAVVVYDNASWMGIAATRKLRTDQYKHYCLVPVGCMA
jgi:hypothetical protein